eukprot:1167753-Pyramimonas_sp.AAC.1
MRRKRRRERDNEGAVGERQSNLSASHREAPLQKPPNPAGGLCPKAESGGPEAGAAAAAQGP